MIPRSVSGLAKRILPDEPRGRMKYALARVWRATALAHVPFATVTGSLGKTTTALMLGAIMATRGRTAWTLDSMNGRHADLIVRMGPRHRFGVAELAENVTEGRRSLASGMAMFRPRVGIVTTIGSDHLSAFTDQDALARAVSVAVSGLPPGATAVLNADDPLVRAMTGLCRGPVVTFGAAPDADVRVEAIADTWPERLSFDLVIGDDRRRVVTRMCGGHWAPFCAAAIAAARVLGVAVDDAIAALGRFAPVTGRMEPRARDDGIAFILDEYKNPLWGIAPVLEYLDRARSARKVMVIGSISDYQGTPEQVYGSVAAQALDIADLVLFVGPRASKARRVRHPRAAEAFRDFVSVDAAAAFLGSWLRPGDLVLLKGIRRQDGLNRLARLERGVPVPAVPRASAAVGSTRFAVIGLGNMGPRYDGTPHNAGVAFIEWLARNHGATWTERDAWFEATVRIDDYEAILARPRAMMNHCGPAVAAALAELGLSPDQALIVHDDSAVPLGAVRVRQKGSDGGHKGVRSILQTLATEAPGRVKIGVAAARMDGKDPLYFITPFTGEERERLERSHEEAKDKLRLALHTRFHDLRRTAGDTVPA